MELKRYDIRHMLQARVGLRCLFNSQKHGRCGLQRRLYNPQREVETVRKAYLRKPHGRFQGSTHRELTCTSRKIYPSLEPESFQKNCDLTHLQRTHHSEEHDRIATYISRRREKLDHLEFFDADEVGQIAGQAAYEGLEDVARQLLEDLNPSREDAHGGFKLSGANRIDVLQRFFNAARSRHLEHLEDDPALYHDHGSLISLSTLLNACQLFCRQIENREEGLTDDDCMRGFESSTILWIARIVTETSDMALLPLVKLTWAALIRDPQQEEHAYHAIRIVKYVLEGQAQLLSISSESRSNARFDLESKRFASAVLDQATERDKYGELSTDLENARLNEHEHMSILFAEMVPGECDKETIGLVLYLHYVLVNYSTRQEQWNIAVGTLLKLSDYSNSMAPPQSNNAYAIALKLRHLIQVMLYSSNGTQRVAEVAHKSLRILTARESQSSLIDITWFWKLKAEALAKGEAKLITDLLVDLVANSDDHRIDIDALLSPEEFLTIMQTLNEQRDVSRSMNMLRLYNFITTQQTVSIERFNAFFLPEHQGRILMILARLNFSVACQVLYEAWGEAAPLVASKEALHNEVDRMKKDIRNCLISQPQPFRFHNSSFLQSTPCMAVLVRLLVQNRSPVETGDTITKHSSQEPSVTYGEYFAMHIMRTYLRHKQNISHVDARDLPTLATALFTIKLTEEGFLCLQLFSSHKDFNPASVGDLVRSLAYVNAEAAYNVLKSSRHDPSMSHSFGTKPYTAVLGQLLSQGKIDKAQKLLTMVKDTKLEDMANVHIVRGLVSFLMLRDPSLIDPVDGGSRKAMCASNAERMLATSRWIEKLIVKENWIPDATLLSWMTKEIAMEQPSASFEGDKKKAFAEKCTLRRTAFKVFELSALHLHQIDARAIRAMISCYNNSAVWLSRNRFASQRRALNAEIDRFVGHVRWVEVIHNNVEANQLPVHQDNPINLSKTPNILSRQLFRLLILLYIRVGDVLGAAQVMDWARISSNITFTGLNDGWRSNQGKHDSWEESVKRLIHANRRHADDVQLATRALLYGEEVRRTKIWWSNQHDKM